jgi:hypothetical protein
LLRLLESLEDDAALHLSGQVAYREVIVGSLINRLLLTEACKQTPETFRKPLKPPIIFQEHASKLVPDLNVHVVQLGDNLSS